MHVALNISLKLDQKLFEILLISLINVEDRSALAFAKTKSKYK